MKTEVRNVLQPGKTTRVDAARHAAAEAAFLAVLPAAPPGATPGELIAGMKAQLPQDLFPGGEKAGWWAKCVQLDLEARGLVQRSAKPPVRLWKA
jgi:hypothetical protein